MPLLIALLLASAFPSTSQTSWMRPDAFRLSIGMSREVALRTLREGGWPAKREKGGEYVVDYTSTKSLTLVFRKNRLHSIRFELFAMLGEIAPAFEEQKRYLRKSLGPPKRLPSKTVILYDGVLPNVMVVASADPKSENGRKGIGMLVVRYYDPR